MKLSFIIKDIFEPHKSLVERRESYYIYIYIYIHILKKITLESKLDFANVIYSYKLNYLDFCCYFLFFIFFYELMSIFFI